MAKGPGNPIAGAVTASSQPMSKKTVFIAGIIVNIYGLEEIPSDIKSVSCLWLLHPRLSKQAHMEPFAQATIRAWNDRLKSAGLYKSGLIAVTFDQRNHGSRLADKLSNEAWAQGNPRHAQDMFSIYQGTASDTSNLITYLPAYAFPKSERSVDDNFVMGVSLGGHAAWHCILQDPRISTAVIVVGCGDYFRLMTGRAASAKLETAGPSFHGSRDFPPSLVSAVDAFDPAGLLMSQMVPQGSNDCLKEPNEREKRKLLPLMRKHLQNKRIMNLAGGSDKLVPHGDSKPFLNWLEKASSRDGWAQDVNIQLVDKVFEGVGHAMTPQMADTAIAFICEALTRSKPSPSSKI